MLVGYRQVKGRRAFAERVRPVWVPGFSRGALHQARGDSQPGTATVQNLDPDQESTGCGFLVVFLVSSIVD